MSKWYRAYGCSITPVKCVKETAKTIIIEREYLHFGKSKKVEDRCLKIASGHSYNYFSTWAEAKNFITNRYEQEIKTMKRVLVKAENTLNKAKSLTDPDSIEKNG